jgi:hypothetical protein
MVANIGPTRNYSWGGIVGLACNNGLLFFFSLKQGHFLILTEQIIDKKSACTATTQNC